MPSLRHTLAALLILALDCFLFESILSRQSEILRQCKAAITSSQCSLDLCLIGTCCVFLILSFKWKDLFLTGLLLIWAAAYCFCYGKLGEWALNTSVVFTGIVLGKVACVLGKQQDYGKIGNLQSTFDIRNPQSITKIVVMVTVALLTYASFWRLNLMNSYHGPRWVGLWDNPNIYGMLMGAGVVLAIGAWNESPKAEIRGPKRRENLVRAYSPAVAGLWRSKKAETGGTSPRPSPHLTPPPLSNAEREKLLPRLWKDLPSRWLLQVFLVIAVFMMGVGLVMSYSRGAWLGTAVGMGYLAWSYGKLKLRYVLAVFSIAVVAVLLFWGRTPDSAPWYVKRLDFGRPSAQHRVAAWRGALHMMWDHPFGVGWNRAVEVYEKNYSPPENGAAAITTNDYLMLGTQLGIPGLVCFVAYVGLCLRGKNSEFRRQKIKVRSQELEVRSQESECGKQAEARLGTDEKEERVEALQVENIQHSTFNAQHSMDSLRAACRAGAVVFLVAFWFDGGLFTLATGAVFWVLLELGSLRTATIADGHCEGLKGVEQQNRTSVAH